MTFDPGPLADVRAETGSGDRPTLVLVRELRHDPDTVWTALTDPVCLRQWAPFEPSRNLGERGPVTLAMIDGDLREDMPGVVRIAERPVVLEYTWGDDTVRWELAASGSGTRLTLRHTVQDATWLSKVSAGWHLCLVAAELLLDGTPIGPVVGSAASEYGWDELNHAYAAKLGIGTARG